MARQHKNLYWIWSAMIQRCTNQNNKQFKDYGGRGITVCDEWRTFNNFKADMSPRPEGLTLERNDNNLGYNKNNCRWATRLEQNNNKRNCIYVVKSAGIRMSLKEYCRKWGLAYRPIVKRIQDRNWPLDMALALPMRKKADTELVIALWDRNEELRDYLQLALRAAQGHPVSERLLNEAAKLCEESDVVLLPPQKVAA